MSNALHLLVRLVHVLGMAAVLGGTVVGWQTLRAGSEVPLATVRRVEVVFWAAMGLLVATGVGNLGTLGPPGPSTRWGTVLTIKLSIVIGVVALSAVRSLAVLRLRAGESALPGVAFDRLRLLYASTAWGLIAVVALAEALAHG
ncbi:hypothetical protein [Halobellus rufus]|uniref:hypothetical protein n=1 Tax=Halobellus rufus TaxID=1448860 RepID=UPI000679A8CC|nr:hypothetical protein [Halobellus rufus]